MMFKTSLKQWVNAATVLAILFTAPVQAHTDEYLDTVVGPHGGQLRMAGAYHFELLVVKNSRKAKSNVLKVFVMDHANTPITTSGATATLMLVAGTQKTKVNLKSESANTLVGEAIYASAADLKVVVEVTLAGLSTQTATFEPLNPKAAAAKDLVYPAKHVHDHHTDNTLKNHQHP